MAQVDSQINLIMLGDLNLILLLLNEESHELVADLRSMLGVAH